MPNAVFRSLTGKVLSAVTRARRAAAAHALDAVRPVCGEPLEERRLFALAVAPVPAAASATALGNALVVPNTGITLTGGTYTGVNNQGGTYTGFDESNAAGNRLRILDGVLLTTGLAAGALGPNDDAGTSTVHDSLGDPDLDLLTQRLTTDANALTLTFTTAPGTQSIMFDFIYGSEEYPEFAGSPANDVFAAYLDGQLVNLDINAQPITTNSIFLQVPNPQSAGFNPASFNLEYDGFTPRVRTQAPLDPTLTTHTLKFVVADNTTAGLDSGVFISRLQGTAEAVGTASTDVPTPGTFTLSNAALSADETAGVAGIVVNRGGGESGQVQVNYAITGGTATAGADFTALSGTVTFAHGETAKALAFPILDDLLVENDETVIVTLSAPVDADLAAPDAATVTILDNEQAISFMPSTYSLGESGLVAGLVVSRSGDVSAPATVNYATADAPGGAVAGQDYAATSGTINFAPGQRTAFITVPIIDDFVDGEANESFTVALTQPAGGSLDVNGWHTATVTLANEDRPPSIYDITAFAPSGRIEALFLQLNEPVVAAQAIDPANYDLFLHNERRFNGPTSRRRVPLAAVDYNPTLKVLVMRPQRTLRDNAFYEVVVRGTTPNGIRGVANEALDGNFDRLPDPLLAGEDFIGYYGRGKRLSYFDRDGDRVTLGAKGGGMIEVFRDIYREPRTVRYLGAVPGSALWGKLAAARRSDDVTSIGTILLNGARNHLETPPFIVRAVI